MSRIERLSAAIPAAAAVATFALCIGFALTNWDDPVYLTESPLVRDLSPQGIVRIFDPRSHVVYDWTPLVTLTYAVEVNLVGVRPSVHHATNVGLHALTAALVLGLLRRMGFSFGVSLFGALFFAVHPLQVESVAWVSGRKTLLATLFGVLCARAYVDARGPRGLLVAGLFFCAALLSKATLVALPIWLVGWDWMRGTLRLRLPWIVPLLALALARTGISIWAQEPVIEHTLELGYTGRLALLGPVLLRYARQIVWPLDLSAHYSWPALGWQSFEVLSSWLIVISLVAGLVVLARRSRAVSLGALFVGAALLPVLNLVPAPHIQADRYLYTALIPVGALLATGLRGMLPSRVTGPLVGIAALVLVTLAVGSAARARVWRGSIPLWEDTVQRDPGSAVAHGNLGAALLTEGHLDSALASLRKALELEPRLTESRLALASVLRNRGELDEARRQAEQAHRADPQDPGAAVLGAELAELAGEPDTARVLYREALRLNPDAVRALERLAMLELDLGDKKLARERIRHARRLRPDLRGLEISEAWILSRTGLPDRARERLETLTSEHPEWAEPHYVRALLALEGGATNEAHAALDLAVELDPRHARARIQRARLLLADGDRTGAEADFRSAVDVVPFRLAAVLPLADLLEEQGRRPEAIALLERTASHRSDPEVYRRIAQLQEETDPTGARQAARRALALIPKTSNPLWRADLERIAR